MTEILVTIAAVGIVGFTIIYNIVRHKKGKSSCGGCCQSCKGCPNKPEK